MSNPIIEQIRTNALVARTIHRNRLKKARMYSGIISALTVLVPIMFLAAQYWSKGTKGESLVIGAASIGSALLLCLSVVGLIMRIDLKILNHSIGINNNILVASEALKLEVETDDIRLNWFYRYVAEIDMNDANVLADASSTEKQDAYREALKESHPGDTQVVCPICRASPFQYMKGTCQTCGNTPTEEDF